jgi:hypothetical protein
MEKNETYRTFMLSTSKDKVSDHTKLLLLLSPVFKLITYKIQKHIFYDYSIYRFAMVNQRDVNITEI